ncbi:hypothetical protein [Microcystis aeruginosa]|uniref:Uncharacterized protein n=1 Tax=Microcystis aeruginosa PCC 9443 TaxID=1160281 RepID=I4G427_MICAE|nr:hypothetical protein [Microcystis aeruginosa]CCI02688.1 hypothetical protein MICAC_3660002 [Microcystis aeruginosa PCC 9443]
MTTTTHKLSDYEAALIAAKKILADEGGASRSGGTKIWHCFLAASPQAAVNHANSSPPQGAGEACFSVLDNGQTWVFEYF